jgi:HAD superfamily hydrolase (TIGR01490 family)
VRLALFDLDGTLLPGDSDHAFGEFLVRLGWADGTEFARRNDGYFADYQRGRLDIADYIEFVTEPWRRRPLEEAQTASRRFVAEIIRPMLRPAAQDLVERHRRAGDRLAIVTATNDFVTRPIAELLGVPDLIATELERDPQGRATGAIRGVPSFREGKVERVQAWLAEQGASLDGCEKSIFYSDSTNDLPLLERVSDPVATNPGPALERLARERGWPVLKLFE